MSRLPQQQFGVYQHSPLQQQRQQNSPLRLQSITDGLRVRQAPVSGQPIGQANPSDILEVLEAFDSARDKVGKTDQWIKIRTPAGVIGYVSAQFVKIAGESAPAEFKAAAVEAKPAEQPTSPAEAKLVAPHETKSTPAPAPFRVQPIDTVNIRQSAAKNGKILAQAYTSDILDVKDAEVDAKSKIGNKEAWLSVKTQYGLEGFVSAGYMQPFTGELPKAGVYVLSAPNITGMNLDRNHPLGRPSPDLLRGIGWIRVKFNVSFNPDNGTYGNTDIDAAYNRTKSFIEPYVRAGMKVCMVFTHQLFGEGAGYNWQAMDTGRWNDLIPKYADFAKRAAQKFLGTGMVHVYQIWNEQDTRPQDARAAVPIPSADYANMLAQTIRAIRSVDKVTSIITGGHTRGPGEGSDYARRTIAALPGDIRPDGIASHPYGRGVRGHQFSNWGALDDEVDVYSRILPGKPIWFTEWGVLDRQGNDSVNQQVVDYSSGFINLCKVRHTGKIAAAMWYAWADSMDNGYGLMNASGKPRNPLHERFLKF